MMKKKALLIIDMQKGSFTSKTPRYDTDDLVDRINKMTTFFRTQNALVAHIQHDGTDSGEFEKNSEEWELLDGIEIVKSDLKIDKYANDVFYNSDLEHTLIQNKVEELYIMGCATDFCVESTVQSALTKDYQIVVLKDGHTTGERPELTAKQVIDHYNWVWVNMIPTKGNIEVKTTQFILEK